jgi:8-oxo-dGTP diphosphatase
MKKIVHVAVGVIFDCGPTDDGNILIAKRADHQHQGGLWEFPGGKVEEGESASQALQRELEEELGLQCELEDMTPLISIPFHYPDKSVLLDVWAVHNVIRFDKRIGKENQPLRWVEKADLKAYDFPAANKAIINALLLPKQIAISQDHSDADVILAQVATTLKNHHNVWLQLRAPSLDQLQYTQLAMKLYGICHEAGSKLIWNCPLDWYQVAFADGLHLSRKNYADAKTHSNNIGQRPIPEHQWLSMACHNLAELEVAHDMADYVLVSPVKETSTHRQATPLTWSGFNVISQQARIPCYALGGMNISDITSAVQQGGQGIAAIRCFVDDPAAADENNAMKGKCYES